MDTALVSARMSRAKKERAGSILESIGVTASDLINSAYDYVIETHQLPFADRNADVRNQEGFAAFVESSTLEVEWPQDAPDDYKELARKWRLSDYESLA